MTLELAIFVSGSGTNLQAILDAVAERRLDARVRVVVSNKPDAFALERAKRAGMPTAVISHRGHPTRESFDAALVEVVRQACPEEATRWIVLAGFMRVLTSTFIDAFPARIVNVHPALLPAFPGVHAQAQAIAARVAVAGCTVHLVELGVDSGPILAQAAVPVAPSDDVASLTARILAKEHAILPVVLQWLADHRLTIVDGRPRFDEVVPSFGVGG